MFKLMVHFLIFFLFVYLFTSSIKIRRGFLISTTQILCTTSYRKWNWGGEGMKHKERNTYLKMSEKKQGCYPSVSCIHLYIYLHIHWYTVCLSSSPCRMTDSDVDLFLSVLEIWLHPFRRDRTDAFQTEAESHPNHRGHDETQCGKNVNKYWEKMYMWLFCHLCLTTCSWWTWTWIKPIYFSVKEVWSLNSLMVW